MTTGNKFDLPPVLESLGMGQTGTPKIPSIIERGANAVPDVSSNWKVYFLVSFVILIVLYGVFKMKPSGIFSGKAPEKNTHKNIPSNFTLI